MEKIIIFLISFIALLLLLLVIIENHKRIFDYIWLAGIIGTALVRLLSEKVKKTMTKINEEKIINFLSWGWNIILAIFTIAIGSLLIFFNFLYKIFVGEKVLIENSKIISYKKFAYNVYAPRSNYTKCYGVLVLIKHLGIVKKIIFLNDQYFSFDNLLRLNMENIPGFYCRRYFLYKDRLFFEKIKNPSLGLSSFIKRKIDNFMPEINLDDLSL